jgi:hypothetical protein
MRRALLAMAAAWAVVASAGVQAEALSADGIYIRDCLTAAGNAYHEPPAVLVILLNVEGGRLGAVSPNTNGTVDIGPMQVNDIWLPKLAAHWATSRQAAYRALRDNFCANVEAGAWILRIGLDEAHGDFWEGVGYYHSHDPGYERAYLSSVLKQATRLQTQARAAAKPLSSLSPAPEQQAAAPVSVASTGGY